MGAEDPKRFSTSSELSDSVNMDSEWEESQFESILDSVDSLDDLTPEVIAELRVWIKKSPTIEKFKNLWEQYMYDDWVDKFGKGDQGVEFDGQTECLVHKPYPGWMGAVTSADVIFKLLWKLKKKLKTATSRLIG